MDYIRLINLKAGGKYFLFHFFTVSILIYNIHKFYSCSLMIEQVHIYRGFRGAFSGSPLLNVRHI